MAADVLVAVAHGTRAPEGPVVLDELLDGVRSRLPGVPVHLAYVDVIEPTLEQVLASVHGRAVVVPMFLASGYHVRVDVPNAVEATGGSASVTAALGPDDALVAVVADRLRAAGAVPDAVVLAAAGSSDAGALAEVESVARRLETVLDREVAVGYVTTASPSVGEAVESLRASGARTVGIASYLLAPGLFQQRLAEAGADVVAAPIGAHEAVMDLVVERFRTAE
ncbi:CbiX/SirB N-terminal domain-containing protein [Haloactinopolyspora sp.]|uniref:sirohydrochlorin chelatase n=1 Tax=Haloactinopolyspora sp. TaxID=1966353 RepID=UPI0026345563|nr:CbiX/SirB N-terminal domain-containing protein [Haloactinopolyspora sp.]